MLGRRRWRRRTHWSTATISRNGGAAGRGPHGSRSTRSVPKLRSNVGYRRPERVLLTTSTFPMDEEDRISARFILDLAQHLTAHVRVFVLAPAGPRTCSQETWGDVTVIRYRYFAPSHLQLLTRGQGMLAATRSSRLARVQVPLMAGAQWILLPHIVRSRRIDLVNAHWIVPQGFIGAFWRRHLGIPHVVTAHGADVAVLARRRAGRRLARYVFDRTDYFVADSEYLAKRTEELVGRPLEYRAVPMGVSESLFAPDGSSLDLRHDQEERILLFVGKLVPKKGVNVLLDALHRVRGRVRSVRLILIGGGPLEQRVRDQIADLRLGDTVDMLGWVKNSELPRYYRAADVVCIPSIQDERGETEGTPVVLQEALACGAVVVTTRTSGIPDVVRDGVNGWMVPPDDPEALADAVVRAISAPPEHREEMARRARETAMGHSWDLVAERFMASFDEAARKARSGR